MKKGKIFLILTLLLFPTMVLASNGESSQMSIGVAIFVEAFVSIHMSVFVLMPLASIFDPDKSKKLFKKLFVGRIIVLLIFDFFITPSIAALDFFAVFIGAFLIVPITAKIKKIPIDIRSNRVIRNANITSNSNVLNEDVILKCTKCENVLNITDKFCKKCGAEISGNNVQAIQDTSPIVPFDSTYDQNEKTILRNLLIEELKFQGENEKSFITISLNKKKNILLVIFGVATFIFTLMFYFNYSLILCLFLELIALFIYYLIGKRFNVLNVLTKQAMKNPNEDISTLVKTIKDQKYNSIIANEFKFEIVVLAIILIPTIYFFNPRVLYIRYSDGYSVLRYTRDIVNADNIVNIPDTYKGKQVLSISESAFENSDVEVINLPNGLKSIKTKAFLNAKNLKKIEIPSTVEEIRGSAFENCTNLTDVVLHEGLKEIRASAFENNVNLVNIDLPNSLEYLGASAFSYCSSIKSITIPLKVTEINGATFAGCTSLETVNLHDNVNSIHGETFMNCTNLTNITLPKNITEIKGSTFENCTSLKKIDIPDGVTRIGGSAFRDCSRLAEVTIPETVNEIGSSAFRNCYQLDEVTISRSAYVNERAFKDSYTAIYYYGDVKKL